MWLDGHWLFTKSALRHFVSICFMHKDSASSDAENVLPIVFCDMYISFVKIIQFALNTIYTMLYFMAW